MKKIKKMKKRILALLLCFAMILNINPAIPLQAFANGQVSVTCDEDPVKTVILPQNERIQLTADREKLGDGEYQWQILAFDSIWVDIAGASDETLMLSYAMVASLLDNEEAAIRCKVTNEEEVVYSSEVCVTIDYDVEFESEENDGQVTEKNSDNFSDSSNEMDADYETATGSNSATATDSNSSDPDEETPRVFRMLRSAVSPEYDIVINYEFEDGSIAHESYTATIQAGVPFSAVVENPAIMGYLPYNENNEQVNQVEINCDIDWTEDIEMTIIYKPTLVNYTVIHYQQNVDNDNYTEVTDDRETRQGLTKSTVPEVAKDYPGFYALIYEKPLIAADGSTVVEVYYDRGYYLMNFDLGDGAYGTEPIYARYGSPLGEVSDPIRAGYVFKGWSLDGTTIVNLPDAMPSENTTYKAVWETDGTARVTVVFWGENADDEEYSYIKSEVVNVKPGTEFTYSEDGSLICGLEAHTHSEECNYACGVTEHSHSASCYELTCTQEVHSHSESCYICGEEENHTHSTSCYLNVGDKTFSFGKPNDPSEGQVYKGVLDTYIYISGTWYSYSGNTSSGSIAPTICGKTENHTHTDACLKCGKVEHTHTEYNGKCYTLMCTESEHTHSNACGYACGKISHTHTSSCYMSDAGLNSDLWTFVESETVTVAADGSSIVNVKYDRTEKTLTFKYKHENGGYQATDSITAKWGADISTQYKTIANNAGSTFWSAKDEGGGPYTNYFGVMPETSATYYNRGTTGGDGTMTYYGEDLNGTYQVMFSVSGVGGFNVTDEDRYEFEGFTYHQGTPNGSSCRGAEFYYTRNSYDLVFNDGYNDVKTESVKYEAPLDAYADYVPEVPSAYEPGSVTFGGWYLNPECTGVEYDLLTHTMPASNLILYAKWVPVQHTVEFYLDETAFNDGTKLSTHPDVTVDHGSKITPTPEDPTNGSYTFVGWFYQENGVEKAFDFANMPVNKDLQVYGKWSSNVLKEYTILYKIQGTDTEIADPATGSALAGITKTFEAKSSEELYEDYQDGYFPVVTSHSLTIDINATEENDTNEFTFWYVQKDAVPYIVRYVDEEGVAVATEKIVAENRKAVVTETFVTVKGMLPDAYQKRLIVTGDEGIVDWITVTVDGKEVKVHPDNVITFIYVKDTEHAYYKITHYTENIGGSGWSEYASSEAVGDIGKTYTAEPIDIEGFKYDKTVSGTVISGKLTESGLELKLYYTRNEYPYLVKYLEYGTGNELADSKNGTGEYGEVVSESAINISGYDKVEPTSSTLVIRVEDEPDLNVIIFYYKESDVSIRYVAVGPAGVTDFGSVSPETETVKIMNGTVSGSTPAAAEGYQFVGWYKDEVCTNPVEATWVNGDNHITPQKTVTYGDAAAPNAYETATYYAKFERALANLKIQKVVETSSAEKFVFEVRGSNGTLYYVTIEGNGSAVLVDLPIDTYTVTEQTDWSWRYQAAYKNGAFHADAESLTENGNVVNLASGDQQIVVTNTSNGKTKWIDGSTWCQNLFRDGSIVRIPGNS